ncbi:MAG TPA: type II CAAX endopeptidase family protein [Candidatus Saccharimonadales bacterium]
MGKQETGFTKVPWNPVWAVAFAVIIYFAAAILGGLLLWAGVSLFPLTDAQADVWLTDSTAGQFVYVLIVQTLSMLGVAYFLWAYKQKWSVIGFKPPRLKDVGAGLLAYPLYFVVYAVVFAIALQLVPSLESGGDQQLGFDNVQGALALAMTFISLVVLPPLIEEIVVRGLIFTSLRKWLKFGGAALVTSLVFAAAHLPQGENGLLYVAALDTFLLSIVLCYLREKTGSLWAGITLHFIKNGVAFLALFVFVSN